MRSPLRGQPSIGRWAGIAGLVVALGMAGCARTAGAPPSEDDPLTVFAAASLAGPFDEMGAAFTEVNPGTRVGFNFAASDQLAQQILAGGPADLFASANAAQMQVVVDAGMANGSQVRVFARNRMAIVVPPDNPAGIESLADLATPGIRLVLAAGEVPAGSYALAILDRASDVGSYGSDFRTAVLANVRSYEENVRAVLAKVVLGEADAGIVYASDAVGSEDGVVVAIEIPPEVNIIAEYLVAPVSGGEHPDQALEFLDTLFSAEGQSILAEAGFEPADP